MQNTAEYKKPIVLDHMYTAITSSEDSIIQELDQIELDNLVWQEGEEKVPGKLKAIGKG